MRTLGLTFHTFLACLLLGLLVQVPSIADPSGPSPIPESPGDLDGLPGLITVGTLPLLDREADPGKPAWLSLAAPVREGRWAEALYPTRITQRYGLHRAWSRAMDLSSGDEIVAQEIWTEYCFLLPAIPGTLTPLPQASPDALANWQPMPVAEVNLSALWFAFDHSTPGTILIPQVQEDQQVHLERRTLKADPVYRADWELLYDYLEPENPFLQSSEPVVQASKIISYGQLTRDPHDARYGELMQQVRGLVSRAAIHLQDFPTTLTELFQASLVAPFNVMVSSTEAEPADLRLYFDGQQVYRFVLSYPSGLQEDSVVIFTHLSPSGSNGQQQSILQYDPEATVAWQFVGGLKLQ